jgi:hypothetical protein
LDIEERVMRTRSIPALSVGAALVAVRNVGTPLGS